MAKNGKNRALNAAAHRLTGEYAGDRNYERVRYQVAILLALGRLNADTIGDIDRNRLIELWEESGEAMP